MVDSSACAYNSDQPVHISSQVTESGAESEEKGNFLILAIPIPIPWNFNCDSVSDSHWNRRFLTLPLPTPLPV